MRGVEAIKVLKELLVDVRGEDLASEIFYLIYLFGGVLRTLRLPKAEHTLSLFLKDSIIKVKSRCNSLFFCPKKANATGFILPYYERLTWSFIKSVIKPGDIFIDVGAHIGAYSIPVAKLGGKVFAIEPAPKVFEALTENIKINSLDDKVVAINAAAYSSNSEVKFLEEPLEFTTVGYIDNSGELSVKAITLDKITNDYNLRVIKLLKIDVEGAELEVLKGANETLEKTEYVIIEVRETTERQVRQMLEKKEFLYSRYLEGKGTIKNLLFKKSKRR